MSDSLPAADAAVAQVAIDGGGAAGGTPAAAPPEPAPAGASKRSASVGVTIARNSVWLLLDTAVGMAVTFFSSVVVARKLGPDITGNFNYILSFASMLRLVSEAAVPATVRKFAAEFMGRGDYVALKTLVSRALRLLTLFSIIGVSAGLVIVMLTFPAENRNVAALAVLTVVPSLMISIPTGALWATEDLRSSSISSLLAAAVNLAGIIGAVFFGWGLIGLVAAILVSRTVDCIIRFGMFRRQYAELPGVPGERLEREVVKRMVPFAGQQMVLTILFTMLFDRIEVFFLKPMAATREIAFFSISFTLVQYLMLFPKQLSGSAGASMMVKQGKSPAEAARIAATACWFMLLIAAPVDFGVAALSDPLLRSVYGARYLGAIPVLTVLSLFGIGLAASQPAQYLLVAAERQIFYIVWLATSGLVDVGLCLLLIPRYGALGAAWAKGASQVVGGIGFLVYMVRRFDVRLPLWRMLKLLLACAWMFLGVRLVASRLPAILALTVGIPVGVAIFAVLTRLFKCLDRADRDRLREISRLLPGRARGAYLALVRFLVPV